MVIISSKGNGNPIAYADRFTKKTPPYKERD
jgi:hypothetical protein